MGGVCTRLLPWGNHLVVPTANHNDNSGVAARSASFLSSSLVETTPNSSVDALSPPGALAEIPRILSLSSEKEKEEVWIESDEEGRTNEDGLSAPLDLPPLLR